MTLYARGYRPYEGAWAKRRPGFVPIQREGYRLAVRRWSFWILFGLGLATFLLFSVFLYMRAAFANAKSLGLGEAAEPTLAAAGLEATVWMLQGTSSFLGWILCLLVGAGLVADDLKSRALPLYLVRPITPLDYWLGKLLIPVRVLLLTVLVPALALILVGSLFRPSDEMLPFLWERRGLALGVLAHFAVAALSFSSLVLLVSTWVGSRGGAIALGAVVFIAGGAPQVVARFTPSPFSDLLMSTSLPNNAQAMLLPFLRPEVAARAAGAFPPVWSALLVSGSVVCLAAWVVVSRARTAEMNA